MDNDLTQEQIDSIKEELERVGIPFAPNGLNPINSKEYISSVFSHITIPEIEEKISNFQKID